MCYSSENTEKRNAARVAYDLELELIERDLEFDLGKAIQACDEASASGDRAASLIRHAIHEFNWRRRYARHVIDREFDR
jgi:hypothetical protein